MSSNGPQLLVVLPIYNEQVSLRPVVQEWFTALSRHAPEFVLLAIDDGSKDDTKAILDVLAAEHGERLEIMSRPNRGHGQTCIEGYRIALDRRIPYILQIDSDGQSDPRHFPDFWKAREDHDVIYGKRSRQDGLRRILASGVLRLLLRLLTNVDCVDANVPYRLMNSPTCAGGIRSISPEFFLANIALAVALKRNPAIRHGKIDITFPARIGGEASVPFSKFAAKAIELFRQLKTLSPEQTK